jgi:hypothetical protein
MMNSRSLLRKNGLLTNRPRSGSLADGPGPAGRRDLDIDAAGRGIFDQALERDEIRYRQQDFQIIRGNETINFGITISKR